MPINLLKDLVVSSLDSTKFSRPRDDFVFSSRTCFKQSLLSGNGVDVSVVDENTFSVSIQANRYYEAVATDFHFSLVRVSRQRDALANLISSGSPGAWVLVTAYYLAFYSAIEVSRLCGIRNMTLASHDIDYLNDQSLTTDRLLHHGAFLGISTFLDDGTDSIVVRFSKSGSRPHHLAWLSLTNMLTNSAVARLASEGIRLARIQTFKDVIGSARRTAWPSPREVRNEWNYSKVDSYTAASDKKTRKLQHILSSNEFAVAKSWADQKKGVVGDEENIASLGYVCIVLENVMNNIKSKLLPDA